MERPKFSLTHFIILFDHSDTAVSCRKKELKRITIVLMYEHIQLICQIYNSTFSTQRYMLSKMTYWIINYKTILVQSPMLF